MEKKKAPAVNIDKVRVPKEQDARVKLTDAERESIKTMWCDGASIKGLAKLFNVSRRTIQFILFPSRKEKMLEARKARFWKNHWYKRRKHNIAMRRCRNRKRTMLEHGIISKEGQDNA